MSVANQRGCYCKPGDVTCGECERCGAPGHTRHFPGPVPATGAWCDRCYRIVGVQHLVVMRVAPFAVVLGIAVFAARSCGG
jgi:hypothetical protein